MPANILDLLFRDPVLSRLSKAEAPAEKIVLPKTVTAKVVRVKGDLAMLRWSGGTFSAELSASASPGETLLLKHSGLKEKRPHYRIMARLTGAGEEQGARVKAQEPLVFGWVPPAAGEKQEPPALVRFTPERLGGKESLQQKEPLLELCFDTEHLGLVMVQFFFLQKDRFSCQFVVETREAGELLQAEAERLIREAGASEEEAGEPLRWMVGNVRRVVAEVVTAEGLSLNKKV